MLTVANFHDFLPLEREDLIVHRYFKLDMIAIFLQADLLSAILCI